MLGRIRQLLRQFHVNSRRRALDARLAEAYARLCQAADALSESPAKTAGSSRIEGARDAA